MDRWRFFDITHRDHLICNPTSVQTLDELIGLLQLPPGARVLDIACGKAEFCCRVLERYVDASAVAVDLSPPFVEAARARLDARGLAGRVELIEMDGAAYDASPASFDAAFCLGASWIWHGHAGTLRALAACVRPGGTVLVGEPYWLAPPAQEYLEATSIEAGDFASSHAENVQIGVDLGLVPLYATSSSHSDWDRYEATQWQAVERWAAAHADDPDREEIVRRTRQERDLYLRHGRDTLNWGLYLFQVPS